MTKPLIQVVDTNDCPVRGATKDEVWGEGLLHRIVRIMIERPDGKILLQRRSPNKALFPNCWDNSAAGHVDLGEDYHTAAVRELAEELGVTKVPLTEIGRYATATESDGRKTYRFNVVYKASVGKTPTKLAANEVEEVQWFSLDEI